MIGFMAFSNFAIARGLLGWAAWPLLCEWAQHPAGKEVAK